jgi:hypothetical protein
MDPVTNSEAAKLINYVEQSALEAETRQEPSAQDTTDFQNTMDGADDVSGTKAIKGPDSATTTTSPSGATQASPLHAPGVADAAAPVANVGKSESPGGGGSDGPLGDLILGGLHSLSSQYKSEVGSIDKTTSEAKSQGSLSVQNELNLELETSKMVVQEDVASKLAGEGVDGIETLFKNQ